MDTSSRISDKTNKRRHDMFGDTAMRRPAKKSLSYGDGFRFGIGFMVAHLMLGLIIGGLAYVLVVTLRIH